MRAMFSYLEAIPIEGRIVAIVDVFDALTNERPYKKAWPIDDALAELQKQSGLQFDPRCIEAFLTLTPLVETPAEHLEVAL